MARAVPHVSRPNQNKRWTPDEDEIFIKARSHGGSIDNIARRLGRSAYACVRREQWLVEHNRMTRWVDR